MRRRLTAVAIEAWLPVALVATWWFASANSTSIYFPPLQTVLERFQELWLFERVPTDVAFSLTNLGLGLGAGLVAALAAGVAFGLMPPVHTALTPVFEFMRATPIVALLPLIVAMFGLGVTSKVVIIALGAFWPTFLNTVDGVRAVDPLVRDVARTYRLSAATLVTRVMLPNAAPQIMVGVRTSVSVAVVIMVGSELFGSSEGIGYFILQSQRSYAIVDMWAGLILLGLLGYALNLLSAGVERLVLSWHEGRRTGSTTVAAGGA